MKATVIRAFLRNEVEMQPNTSFECSDQEFAKLRGLGFVQAYETKVAPKTQTKTQKKSTPSAVSQAGRAAKKKTVKRSKKSAKK